MFRVLRLFEVLPFDGTPKQYGSITIPAEGLCLYGAGKLIKANRQQLYQGLINNELTGTDIFDQTLDLDGVLSDVLYLGDEAEAYDLSSPVYQVNWNMRAYPQLISLVRGEMLAESLTQMGLSATGMLQKLANVVGAIQVGMFKEAWQMLYYSVERDAFLTEARIGKYVKILQSSDAIEY